MRRLAAAVLSVAMVSAVTTEAPQPSPWKERPARFALSSGIPCIYHRDRSSPTTVVELFAAGGLAAVPAGQDGLAYLATRLTLEIPDEGKVQELMSQATRMSLLCEEDCSIVLIECLSENLERALRVASVIIQDPLITGLRIGRIKEMMKLYGRAVQDDSRLAGHGAVLKAFFPGQGYGTSLYGTVESLKAIDRKDLLEFNRRYFSKPNLFFCVASDLDSETVRPLLETYFGGFPDGASGPPDAPSPALPEDSDIKLTRETKQTYIGRAFVLPPPDGPGQAKGYLLETLLGKGPGSRLWALRMTEKLAYNVDARVTWTRSAGILEAFLETDSAKRARAASALDRALSELRTTGVTEEELRMTRTMAKAQFLRAIEAKAPRMRTIGLFEVLGLGHNRLEGLFGAIDAVTVEDMNVFMRSTLDAARALKVTVGPEGPGPRQGGR